MIDFLIQLFVSIFGVLFQKAIENNRDFGLQKGEDSKVIIEPIKHIEVVHIYKQPHSKTGDDNNLAIIMLGVFLLFYPFIKYQNVISIVLISVILILEAMIMYIVCSVTRRGWQFDNEAQSLVIFNMVVTLLGLVILVLMKTPLFFKGYSPIELKNYIDKYGIIKLMLDDWILLIYIISQMGAVLLLIVFIIKLILSNVSLLALIRIKVTGKAKGIWFVIYDKMGNSCRNIFQYIKGASVLLLISFLFMSGAFVKFIEWIQKIGTINM